ncbi:MAG TPA: paraquat-inducible protein A [Geminicoccaceae bacterium]|nr:paraquat-inducible protein A [Geminicoccaceae bacterium]
MNSLATAPPSPPTPVLACHECGLVQRVHELPPGAGATCAQCGATLYSRHRGGLERVLAWYVTALVLFVLANSFPFITLTLEGRQQPSLLLSGGLALWRSGMELLAGLVLAAAIVMPLVKILVALWVLVPVHLGRLPPLAAPAIRALEAIGPWAMMEVYLLGVLVAYVKLIDLATLELGVSLWAFVALIVVMIAADAALDKRDLWERLAPQATTADLRAGGGALVSCHTCEQLVRLAKGRSHGHCPRCGAALHPRKPDSLNRTWALVLTAAILYVPANVLPVMTVVYFGRGEPDTILSGVKELIAGGMWPLALLVFFASILVPMLKLSGLTFLLISVQRGSTWRRRDRTLLYRIIEAIGRWSMIDIFMIGILAALVNLGAIATIEPGLGAVCFAAVVVITILASMSFDPRLIWDVENAELARPQALRA